MKLQICSDVHTEFHSGDQGRKLLQKIGQNGKNVDALIVAGDLSTSTGLRYAFSILCDLFKNVIYVQGNHEYYHVSKKECEDLLQECADKHSNLHWLNRTVKEVDGQRFAGTTLWFPPTEYAIKNRFYLNDFNVITDAPDWILNEFSKNKSFLATSVKQGDVVVTHHMPCKEAIHPNWAGDPGNCFFLGDVTDVIKKVKAKLWVYGHTHDGQEFDLHQTSFVCNPVGYPREGKPFNYTRVVEV